MGYDVVRVKILRGGRSTLQIMVERSDSAGTTIDDCAAISRAVSAVLDVEDPMPAAYELEISTPGIDRPLTRSADFERFAGFQVKLETSPPHEGRRRWIGRLLGLEGEMVRIETDEGEVALPCTAIAKAKLVLTDDFVAAAERMRTVASEGTE